MSERRDYAWIAPALIAAVLCGAAGSYVQSMRDEWQMDKERAHATAELKKAVDGAAEKQKYLEAIIQDQKEHHERIQRQQSDHLASFSRNAAGVRHELETMLADSRRGAQNCAARTDAIAESIGELFDLAGEGNELLREAASENEGLRAENQRLADQVRGLQQFAKGPDLVTVVGKK